MLCIGVIIPLFSLSMISLEAPPGQPGLAQGILHSALCIAAIWDLALEFKVKSKRCYIEF